MKRTVLNVLVYGVFVLALGVLWNLVLFPETYATMTSGLLRDPPLFPLGIAAIVIEGLALTFLFSRFYGGSLPQAFALAIAARVFTVSYAALVVPAKFQLPQVAQYVAMEGLYGAIQTVGAALIFAALYAGRRQAAAAAATSA